MTGLLLMKATNFPSSEKGPLSPTHEVDTEQRDQSFDRGSYGPPSAGFHRVTNAGSNQPRE